MCYVYNSSHYIIFILCCVFVCRPHRPDVERQPSFDFSDSISAAPSDLMSSISTIRDNLRIVPKPEYAEEAGPSHTPSIPLPPDLPRAKSTVERLQLNMRQRRRDVVMDPTSPRSNGISRQESTTTYHSTRWVVVCLIAHISVALFLWGSSSLNCYYVVFVIDSLYISVR